MTTTCGTAVSFVDLGSLHAELLPELLAAVEAVLRRGDFVLGEAVERFERSLAPLTGCSELVSLNSGTDALLLALEGLGIGPGDEVITPPNSFWATAAAIARVGARPVFADVDETLNLDPQAAEAACGPRTRALLVVHLTGRPAALGPLTTLARGRDLLLVEDCAQALGARYEDRPVGSAGDAGCFSFHPLKPLGGCGDGGAVSTRDVGLGDWLRRTRNHGLADRGRVIAWGGNSRLDSLQAALLLVKLSRQQQWTERRRQIARRYADGLRDLVGVPEERPEEYAVYQTFVIRAKRRDALQQYLEARGIGCKVHYPTPIHLQPAAAGLGYGPGAFPVAERLAGEILSLPMHAGLTDAQVDHVIEKIREFHE